MTCAHDNEVHSEGEGTVECESIPLTIHNVTYVPKLASNLLSVIAIARKGHVIVFTENGCDIYKKNECKVHGKAVVKGVVERAFMRLSAVHRFLH